MYSINAMQIKAARVMMDMSREEFANACNLSVNTIRNLEAGNFSPRRDTYEAICEAVLMSGVEFTEGGGVRPRPKDEFKTYEGSNSCEDFFDDMLQTIKSKGGDIACYIHSQEILMQSCGIANRNNLQRLEQLGEIAKIKCLVSGVPDAPLSIPSFQFKVIPKIYTGSLRYYIYGDKCTIVLLDGGEGFKFLRIKSFDWAQERRKDFSDLWDNAVPLTENPCAAA